MCTIGVAFWYKKDSSHRDLYPSMKDEEGKPVMCLIDGKPAVRYCPHGIEVFKNG